MEKQVLHIDCPDEKGLVYKITEVLYRHNLNIVRNQEFVDTATQHFVMRTAYEGVGIPGGLLNDLKKHYRILQIYAGKKLVIVQ